MFTLSHGFYKGTDRCQIGPMAQKYGGSQQIETLQLQAHQKRDSVASFTRVIGGCSGPWWLCRPCVERSDMYRQSDQMAID